MTKTHRAASLLALTLTLAGCGESQPTLGPRPPHGGSLFKLSGQPGSVEVVLQDAEGAPGRSRLLLYYLDAEMKPATPAPAAATLTPKGRDAGPVEFKPVDGAEAGELASLPFPTGGEVVGELTATLNGKPVKAVINVH